MLVPLVIYQTFITSFSPPINGEGELAALNVQVAPRTITPMTSPMTSVDFDFK
jgi:hypothetical protein